MYVRMIGQNVSHPKQCNEVVQSACMLKKSLGAEPFICLSTASVDALVCMEIKCKCYRTADSITAYRI